MKTKISRILSGFMNDPGEGLRISLEQIEGAADSILIEPVGYIDTYNTVYFQDKINTLIESGYINLIFDMSNISDVSAMGIGSFIHLSASVKKYGGEVIITNIQKRVLEIFQLPGFTEYFAVTEDTGSPVLHYAGKG